jgi:hypothetical protein
MHYNDKHICHKLKINPGFKNENITPPPFSVPEPEKQIVRDNMHYKVNETLSASYFSYRTQVQVYKVQGQDPLATCECHSDY